MILSIIKKTTIDGLKSVAAPRVRHSDYRFNDQMLLRESRLLRPAILFVPNDAVLCEGGEISADLCFVPV